jgi:hypothetical protein
MGDVPKGVCPPAGKGFLFFSTSGLVIEIDGDSRAKQMEYDEKRTGGLE